MKYLILIGILLNLPFYVHSLPVLDMSYDDLSTAVALDPNNIDAKAELGFRYLHGVKGTPKNESKAIKLLEEAIEKKGNYLSIHHLIHQLGFTYEMKDLRDGGVGNNLSRATHFYEQAINIVLNNPTQITVVDTTFIMGILDTLFSLHENGRYSSELFLNNGLTLYKTVHSVDILNYSKKLEKLYIKAEQGDTQALLTIANPLTSEGLGFPGERRFALMKASEMGDVTAMLKLADIYIKAARFAFAHHKIAGLNIKYTIKTAVKLLKKAFFQGKSAKAGHKLAHIYRYGIRHPASGEFLIRPNHLNSRTFYKETADLGDLEAMLVLEDIYDKGWLGVKPNKEKANQYYIQYSVRVLEDPNFSDLKKDKIINRLREIAKDGSPEANYQMGRFYRDGSSSIIPSNTAMAAFFFERALEKGEHKEAETALREIIPKDILEANSFACPASFAKST